MTETAEEQVPVDEFIAVLTKCIGRRWKALARELHFSQTDIDSIERANHNDLREEIYNFFRRWKQRVGREASIAKIVEGLRATRLEEELKHMEEAGLVPTAGKTQPQGIQLQSSPSSSTGGNPADPEFVRKKRLERFRSSSDATPPQVSRTTSMASTGSTTSSDRDPDSKMKDLEAVQSPTQLETDKDRAFEVDDLVKWEQPGNTYYGVIRWIGPLLDKQVAGIEMEEKPPGGSSGELQGVHYFDCQKGHGIFLPLEMLKRDDRFDSIKSTELAVQEMNISGGDAEKDQTRRPSADKTPDKGTPSSPASRPSQSLEPTPTEVSPCTSKNRAQQSHSLESTPILAAAAAALFSGTSTDSPLQKMQELLSGSPRQTSVSEPHSSEDEDMILIFRFPGDQAGLIIGREGRNIREVEDKTHARIDIQKRDQHDLGTNGKAVIVGKEENCKKALCMILEDVRRKIARQIATSEIVLIPTSRLCGRVIGKDGSTRNAIERLSGARLKIDQKEGLEGLLDQTRTCRVTGSVEQIEIAKEFIQMAMDGEDIVRMATVAAVIANLMKEFRKMGFEFPTDLVEPSDLNVFKAQTRARTDSIDRMEQPELLDESIDGSRAPSLEEELKHLEETDINQTDSEFLRLFNEAMKEGSIDAEIVKCLFIGTAGAGKTSTIYLLFGWDPPPRHSTGCIESIRAISCIKVGSDGKIWTIVDPQKLRLLLANDILSTFREPKASFPDASDETSTVGTAENLPSERSPSPEQPVSQTGAAVARQMHECTNDGGKLRNMKWLYIIDSGGQSQFHQLLPAFLKDTSAGVFVINLSEELSDHPLMELYDKGIKCGQSHRSPLTNEEVFRSCIQTVQSLPYTTEEGKVPKTFIIGTHQDKETPGTRARKNEQLLRILLPTEDSKESSFHDNLLFSDLSKKEVIYGVDATSREEPNTDIAREIRSMIENLAPHVKRIPHRWYGLELEIEKFAADKNRKVVTLKECLEIGKALRFPSEEAVKAALVHLDDLNIFLYYPKVLPDLVFTSPCVLLDRVRELVQKSYQLKGRYSSDKPYEPTEGKWSHFCDRGIVTFDILERFPSHDRDCEYFTSQQLVQLFKHLLIIAPINETEFFMPALLDLLKPDEMIRPPAEHASAFIINFRGGYAPCGLCSALVACLRSSWRFATSCRKLYGNCITFSLAPKFPALVTLFDTGSYFEVYIVIDAPPSLCSSVCKSACPAIRRKIIDSLKQAITTRNYQNVEYDETILCQCKKANSTPHAATIQINTPPYYWNCTYDHSVLAELGAKELVWFLEAAPAEPSLPSQSTPLTEDDLPKLQRLLHCVRSKWYHIGIQLGIPRGDLDAFKQEAIDCSDCLCKSLTAWLLGVDPAPTIKALEKALSSESVGERSLVKKVLQEFGC